MREKQSDGYGQLWYWLLSPVGRVGDGVRPSADHAQPRKEAALLCQSRREGSRTRRTLGKGLQPKALASTQLPNSAGWCLGP